MNAHLCFDHKGSLPQTVQEMQRRQHGAKILQVTIFELVGQRGGRDPGQRSEAGQRAGCHRGLWDLSWHCVRPGCDHS